MTYIHSHTVHAHSATQSKRNERNSTNPPGRLMRVYLHVCIHFKRVCPCSCIVRVCVRLFWFLQSMRLSYAHTHTFTHAVCALFTINCRCVTVALFWHIISITNNLRTLHVTSMKINNKSMTSTWKFSYTMSLSSPYRRRICFSSLECDCDSKRKQFNNLSIIRFCWNFNLPDINLWEKIILSENSFIFEQISWYCHRLFSLRTNTIIDTHRWINTLIHTQPHHCNRYYVLCYGRNCQRKERKNKSTRSSIVCYFRPKSCCFSSDSFIYMCVCMSFRDFGLIWIHRTFSYNYVSA